jgi:hypothetical protein
VKSSDPGEEVDKSEGLFHIVKLPSPCHLLWEAHSAGEKVSLMQPEDIFGLHMGDKKSVENLASLLVSYLIANPGSSAKKAAESLDAEKKQVNAILYGRKSVFAPGEGSPPLWSVASVKRIADSEFRATSSKIDLKEAAVHQSERPLNAALGGQSDDEMILNGEDSPEGETALAKAEEFHSAGRLQEALEQYQLASRLFLNRGESTAEEEGDQGPVRIDGRPKIPWAVANGSGEGERRADQSLGPKQGAPTRRTPSLQKEVEEFVWQFPGISYGELALLIGRSEDEVRNSAKKVRYLIIDDSEGDDVDESSVNDRNDELLDVIRTAGTMEFPLSSDGYDDLLRRGFIKGVTSVRIGQIFGSWRRACEIAGVEAPKARRSNYESRWTDQELAEVVALFLTASEYRGAHHRYDEWRRDTGNDDDTPSSGTLRNRLGPGWKAVRRRGLDILRERWLTAEERWLVDGEAERGLG